MWVLQVVCRLMAPLVLSLRRVVLGVLWAMVSSVVPMARVTQAMHRVTVRPVCAVGDALGTGGGGLEGGLPLVQRAIVALVPQVVDRVMVLLGRPTRWFVCLSARGVGAGIGRLPVRVVVAVGVGAPGAWWAWLGAGARVGVYLVRVAGGLWAAGALLPPVSRFVLSGGAWPVCALRVCCGVWSAWVVSVWVFGVGCWLWACRPRGVVRRDGGAAGDVDGDGAAGDKGGTAVLAVSGVGAMGCVERGGVAGVVQVDGGVPGGGVVSVAGGEGVVGDALGGGAAGKRLAERGGRQCGQARCWVLRCRWSAGGGCGWWCGARCVWPVPGILGALVGAGVLMAAVCPPFCPWSWCRRCVAACVRFVPLCVAMVVGVGALGAWSAWLGAGARLDVYLVGSLCCLMVRGWCMRCVDGAGVGAWGWVLYVGASPARCGRA